MGRERVFAEFLPVEPQFRVAAFQQRRDKTLSDKFPELFKIAVIRHGHAARIGEHRRVFLFKRRFFQNRQMILVGCLKGSQKGIKDFLLPGLLDAPHAFSVTAESIRFRQVDFRRHKNAVNFRKPDSRPKRTGFLPDVQGFSGAEASERLQRHGESDIRSVTESERKKNLERLGRKVTKRTAGLRNPANLEIRDAPRFPFPVRGAIAFLTVKGVAVYAHISFVCAGQVRHKPYYGANAAFHSVPLFVRAVLFGSESVIRKERLQHLHSDVKDMTDAKFIAAPDENVIEHGANGMELRLRVRRDGKECPGLVDARVILQPCEAGNDAVSVYEDDERARIGDSVRRRPLIGIHRVSLPEFRTAVSGRLIQIEC